MYEWMMTGCERKVVTMGLNWQQEMFTHACALMNTCQLVRSTRVVCTCESHNLISLL